MATPEALSGWPAARSYQAQALVVLRGEADQHLQAAQLTSGWYFQADGPPELRHRWDRRLAALPAEPFSDPHRPSHARVELVAYPESVTLTTLFTSAHWQENDLLPAEASRRLGIPDRDLTTDLPRKGHLP